MWLKPNVTQTIGPDVVGFVCKALSTYQDIESSLQRKWFKTLI